MSTIQPFKAVRYNPSKVKDLAGVVCPPYDIISPQEQEAFHQQNPNNFIYLLLGKDKPQDDKDKNKYTRAKEIFDDWIKQNILVQDEKLAIYFYRQDYKMMGQKHSRLGFISLMELKDEKDSQVYPHENTHEKAIEDRLKLWRSVKANLSSIFVCFSDFHKTAEKIFHKNVSTQPPLADITDKDGVGHKLWALDQPDLIEEIKAALAGQQLFIADGHHRYRVALEYRRQQMARRKNLKGGEPFHYVMTYFTNIDSKDLKIFPMHRIVKHLPKKLNFLDEFFRMDKVKTKEDLLLLLAKAGRNENAFGLYTADQILLLRLKNKLLIDEYIKEGSPDYKRLDAMILKAFVFDRVGVKSEDIIYTKDLQEAVSLVDQGTAAASFIMNPVKISQLKAIALNGERMPPKTTYFYPKVLSGLTVYRLE